MNKAYLLCIALFVSCLFSRTTLRAQVTSADSLALVDLYNSTNGPSWKTKTNWLSTKPVSTWYGVVVSGGRVTSLSLSHNTMKGKLPASIGNLTGLTLLDFYQNQLNGNIPAVIGNLSNLVTLTFTSNYFKGVIPSSIGKLTKLTYLSFDSNNLTDSIPSSIGKLLSLNELYLGNNQLSGSPASAIGKLVNLKNLDLNSNRFTGNIPETYFDLSNLETLRLNNNLFGGDLSPSIQKLAKLTSLALDFNLFTGSIPAAIGNMKSLSLLGLSNNGFTGTIPSELSKCTTLTVINLRNNKLTGTVPASLATLPNLQYLYITSNELSGDLPKEIIMNLKGIEAEHNHLTFSQNYTRGNTKLGYILIGYNNCTFNGLEFLAQKVLLPEYTPQDYIRLYKSGNKLAVSAGGTLSNNTYRWYEAGTNSLIATIVGDSTFAPSASGKYYATVTNAIATALTLYSTTIDYTKDGLNSQPVTLSPNPAKNYVLISGLPKTENIKISVADLNGNIRLTSFSRQQAVVRLDISRLKPGNYIVNLANGKASKTVGLIKE